MLLKSKITNCVVHSDDWFQGRLGKLTASEFHCFMGDKLKSTGAQSYIFRKVGEVLSGIPSRKEITTAATEHGHEYENENLNEFMKVMGVQCMVVQKLITAEGSKFGATPDGIINISERSDKLAYQVRTVEAKCLGYEEHIRLSMCETALQIKAKSVAKFWQVCFQMSECDCLTGYLSLYQPFFRSGGLKIIEFDKMELKNEFALLEQRKKEASIYFDEVHDYFLNMKPFNGKPLNLKPIF